MHPKPYLHLLLGLLLSFVITLSAQVPGLINYQGRVAVGGVNFDGSGQFKFALVNGDGSFTHWSNDGTFSGEPAAAVTIPVVKGLYSVLLGDTSLTNMQSISSFAFQNEDVRLRVWFNDGTHGFQQLTPDQRIAAAGYAMMAANVPDGAINQFKLAPGAVTGSSIQPGSIDSTHLQNGAVTAEKIAAGAVMRDAIADGAVNGAKISDGAVNTRQIAAAAIGGESWIATPNPEDGPVGRTGHSVIWTGTEFIIWGGVANVFGGPAVSNTGARYNPATDTWTNITLTAAPSARRGHTAVWTGSEMIVWGGTTALDGESGGLNSGGRYNPTTNTWINTGGGIGLPPGRRNHTAVWTGTDMIIWGGLDGGSNLLGDGSKLNGGTNVWSGIAVDDAPEVRHSHTATWTGSKMVIWGGIGPSGPDNTGNVYDAASNVWAATPMPLTGAPTGRSGHSMVWTGTDMIVWGGAGASAQPVTGGTSFQFQNGGRYRVATNSWHPMSATGAPVHRTRHTAVWTGHEMLIWGGSFATDLGGGTNVAGSLDDGAVYIPESDIWSPMAQEGAPAARTEHTAAWTGREMIVWGGNGQGNLLNTGGRYRLSLIANGAVGSRQLADGAVGSGQLAAGAVQSGNLANGAVGSAQLGDYSVTASHLSLGFRSGGLSNGPVTLGPDGFFSYSASFSPPFVAPNYPTVTMASSEWRVGFASLTGFTARAPAQSTSVVESTLPTDADALSSVGLIVQGFPALAYRDPASGDVYYVRATNAEGTAWGTPVVIGTSATSLSSMVSTGGRPSVLFRTSSGLSFVRATDATGAGWAAPSVAASGPVFANPILAEIGGTAGIAYMTGSISFGLFRGDAVYFIRSSNPEGTSWSSPELVATPTAGTDFSSIGLVEAAGRPAIAFIQMGRSNGTDQDLFYTRSNNGTGSSWPAPGSIAFLGQFGVVTQYFIPPRKLAMAIIEGNPAILTVRSQQGNMDSLIYLRSSSAEGGSWEYGLSLQGEPLQALSTGKLTTIAGNPTVTFGGSIGGYLRLKTSTGIGGPSISISDVAPFGTVNLLDIAGMPVGISADTSGIVVKRLDASSAPSADWTASDGTVVPLIAATVQTGAIGTTQLASGAVEAVNIASGAVGTAQLAAGSVTNVQLAKPPQAGSINQGQINLLFGQASFEVSFPQPYSVAPVVTVSLNSSDPLLDGAVVTVESTTTDGLTGRIRTGSAKPVTLEENGNSEFAVTGTSLIFCDSDTLKSKRIHSFSEDGAMGDILTSTIDSGATFRDISVISTTGGDAVAYYDFDNKDLKFARQLPNGNWPSPTVIESSGEVGSHSSLNLIGGFLAVAYYDKTQQLLKYRISWDFGDNWNPVVEVASAGAGEIACQLLEVDGAPAIAYYRRDDDTLRFVRAHDSAGTAWSTPVILDTISDLTNCSLAMVNGRPAICCYKQDDTTIGYYRASDSTGGAWGARVVAANGGGFGGTTSLKVFRGKPAIAFHANNYFTSDSVQFVQASDVDGSAWESPLVLETGFNSGYLTNLRVGDDEAVITFYNLLSDRIESFSQRLTPTPFSVNWIALPQ